jgi:hypothetical protein
MMVVSKVPRRDISNQSDINCLRRSHPFHLEEKIPVLIDPFSIRTQLLAIEVTPVETIKDQPRSS